MLNKRWFFAGVLLLSLVATAAGPPALDTLVLEVEGLSSSCCEDVIRWVYLKELTGVRDVEAEHERGRVTIEFEPAQVSAERIIRTLEAASPIRVVASASHATVLEKIRSSSTVRHTIE